MHDSDASTGHPLSAGSRRRRMLILRSASGTESDSDDFEPNLLEPDSETIGTDSDEFDPQPIGPLERIQEMIEDAMPRTWLFTGDDLGFDARRSKRGCIEFFSDVLKGSLRRRLHVILDTTIGDSRLTTLKRNADWRISRFEPDVVFITPGQRDIALGEHGCERFQTTLEELTAQLQQDGAIVVLCTPPPLGEDSTEVASAYADAIRRTAIECDALLADHWRHWSKCSYTDQLLDQSGRRPTLAGHQKLARNLLRSIGIREF